jgi:hypothetical protein
MHEVGQVDYWLGGVLGMSPGIGSSSGVVGISPGAAGSAGGMLSAPGAGASGMGSIGACGAGATGSITSGAGASSFFWQPASPRASNAAMRTDCFIFCFMSPLLMKMAGV